MIVTIIRDLKIFIDAGLVMGTTVLTVSRYVIENMIIRDTQPS